MNKLIIIGAGGHGKVIADIATHSKKYSEILFLDDNQSNKTVLDYQVVGGIDLIKKYIKTHLFIVAIGDNKIRSSIFNMIKKMKGKFATLQHPSVIISQNVKVNEGTVIMPGCIINVDCIIGKNCIINTGTIIEHECVILDHVHLSPRVTISGNVKIGTLTWIGTGSNIINGIMIGENNIIGSGSNVISNIGSGYLVYGNPASIRSERD